MDPIEAAIEAIESREPGASSPYRAVAKRFGVSRATLSRRHQGHTRSHAAEQQRRQLLNPQQEAELVKYIERCTERGLPPTRDMVRNFASAVAEREASESWVSRFLHRHKVDLTVKWSAGLNRNCHQADSYDKYDLYFYLLYGKMREYDVEPRNTYNIDEKGFFISITTRSKRVFSKAIWQAKLRTAAIKDGNREWITLMACVCGDGEALLPALIYEGRAGLQSSWVNDVEAGIHEVFIANSTSGWTNNDIGLAWLEQVFERYTTEKARRRWRLLIVDGHGSHLTPEFIDFCYTKKILLAVFPPHSTHTLQPLDVVLFSPLSYNYSHELNQHLHQSQALIGVEKRDFFLLFWPAWRTTMRPELIQRSFEATGVWPMDAEVILKRFTATISGQDEDTELQEVGDGDSWNDIRKILDAAVADKANAEAKRLSSTLHSLQVQNELLHHENEGLRAAITTKRRHQKKSKLLDLQQREEYHGGAVLWSPRKIREARARERVKQQEEEQAKLQKTHDRELKVAAILYKK
jgi:transposase